MSIGEKFILKLLRHIDLFEEDINIDYWNRVTDSYQINQINIAGRISSNPIKEKQIIKVTDVLGRDIDNNTKNSTIIYMYNDGSIEKKYLPE